MVSFAFDLAIVAKIQTNYPTESTRPEFERALLVVCGNGNPAMRWQSMLPSGGTDGAEEPSEDFPS